MTHIERLICAPVLWYLEVLQDFQWGVGFYGLWLNFWSIYGSRSIYLHRGHLKFSLNLNLFFRLTIKFSQFFYAWGQILSGVSGLPHWDPLLLTCVAGTMFGQKCLFWSKYEKYYLNIIGKLHACLDANVRLVKGRVGIKSWNAITDVRGHLGEQICNKRNCCKADEKIFHSCMSSLHFFSNTCYRAGPKSQSGQRGRKLVFVLQRFWKLFEDIMGKKWIWYKSRWGFENPFVKGQRTADNS